MDEVEKELKSHKGLDGIPEDMFFDILRINFLLNPAFKQEMAEKYPWIQQHPLIKDMWEADSRPISERSPSHS